jgi:hypothetical protein
MWLMIEQIIQLGFAEVVSELVFAANFFVCVLSCFSVLGFELFAG